MKIREELSLGVTMAAGLLRQPTETVRRHEGQAFLLRPALTVVAGLAIGLGVILSATSLIRANDLVRLGAGPVQKALFPVVWGVLLSTSAGFRYLAIKILEDRPVAFSRVAALTLYAAIPMVALGALAGLIQNFFPLSPLDGRVYLVWMLLLLAATAGAVFVDGRSFVSGARAAFGQNRGRAIITWIAPVVGWLLTFGALYVLILLISLVS